MFAPVASQMAERALTEEMRWASMALAASLESSEDQRPTVRMRSWLYARVRTLKYNMSMMLVNDVRDPVGVNPGEGCTCILAVLSLERTDEDTIRPKKVRDGSAFCEELRVRQDVEAAVGLRVGLEDGAH